LFEQWKGFAEGCWWWAKQAVVMSILELGSYTESQDSTGGKGFGIMIYFYLAPPGGSKGTLNCNDDGNNDNYYDASCPENIHAYYFVPLTLCRPCIEFFLVFGSIIFLVKLKKFKKRARLLFQNIRCRIKDLAQ